MGLDPTCVTLQRIPGVVGWEFRDLWEIPPHSEVDLNPGQELIDSLGFAVGDLSS